MQLTAHLVGMTDATDEIYNLNCYYLAVKDHETAKQAWERAIQEEWKECWADDDSWDFDNGVEPGFPTFRDWAESRFFKVTMFDPCEAIDIQNSTTNKHVFGESGWLSLDDTLQVVEALRPVAHLLTLLD